MAMDVVQVKVFVPDQNALKEVLSAGNFSLDCASPHRDESGNFREEKVSHLHLNERRHP